jgi:hypothetical protein
MYQRTVVVVAAALAIVGLGACSPKPQTPLSSTASVTVDGNDAKISVVKCSAQEWYRTIVIGGNFAGAKVVIDGRAEPPSAQSVRIQNLGGFTGMYSKDDGGDATLSVSGDKVKITGTAHGYKSATPAEPATATFAITATC